MNKNIYTIVVPETYLDDDVERLFLDRLHVSGTVYNPSADIDPYAEFLQARALVSELLHEQISSSESD